MTNDSLRLDPLNALPIETSAEVQKTVDYCKHELSLRIA